MSDPRESWKKRLVKASDETWDALKAQAALEHRPLFAVLATAVREYVKAQRRVALRRPS